MNMIFSDEELLRARTAVPALTQRLELNSGTKGLTAAPVADALMKLTWEAEQNGQTGYYAVQGKARQARHRIARLLGVEENELAFTANATDSLNIAALSLDWEGMRPAPGRPVDVLISDHEYPTTNQVFHYLEQTGKVRLVRYVLSADITEIIASLNANVTDESRIVVASHVDCNTGLRTDVTAISAWCRQQGMISYIDGAQAIGQFPIDLHAIGCDLYISNGHKWLYGPCGVGLLYVRQGFEERMEPPKVGAGTVNFQFPVTFTEGANRFELSATRPAQVYAAMDAALDWLESFGMEKIEQRQRALTAWVKSRIQEMPERFTLICPVEWEKSSAIATIQIMGWSGERIAQFCSQSLSEGVGFFRPVPEFDGLRLSMAYYNIPDEYERFFRLLETADKR